MIKWVMLAILLCGCRDTQINSCATACAKQDGRMVSYDANGTCTCDYSLLSK